ncbi:MAG: XdhC family protein [Planctomycetes bacterium]|nr:XdhC family protein [Planctomycetota bacterium]
MTVAAILAAGASSRMGRPKALLPLGEGTFLSTIIATLRAAGFPRPLVVTGADAGAVGAEAARLGADTLENPEWEVGRFTSVRAAARAAGGGPLLLWPVDCPAVSADTVTALRRATAEHGDRDVVPVHAGRGGHPVLLCGETVRALAAAGPDGNLRAFIREHRLALEVPDPAVLDDLDTPEDLARFLAAAGEARECAEPEAHLEFAKLIGEGRRAALVLVTGTTGSAPRGMGAAMAVRDDGSIAGTVGGGLLEFEAIAAARAALADGRPRRLRFDFTAGPGKNLDMACAGTAELFVTVHAGGPELVLFGAGHVARALAVMAKTAGYRITVLDDRQGHPDPAAFPAGTGCLAGPYAECVAKVTFNAARTFAVIVTHGHERDREALDLCLGRPWLYLGMIGSRAKVARLFREAGRDDAARAALARVRAPIGLDLGGRAPGEIAVSILAEMQAVRYGRDEIRPMRRDREELE